MTAGLNLRVNIIREYISEDVYGGARVASGVTIYHDLNARLEYYVPKTDFAGQQGIETSRSVSFFIKPVEVQVRPDDKLIVVRPSNHVDANRVFRATGISKSSIAIGDRRAFLEVYATRTEEVRTGSFS